MSVDYEKYANEEPSDDILTRLAELSNKQLQLEDDIIAAQRRVEQLVEHRDLISMYHIPALLDEAGVSDVRLSDGTRVQVKKSLRVSTTGRYRDKINAWLEQQGYDDIILDEVTARFGKGESALAVSLIKAANELTRSVARKRYVNAQTFAALVRELLAKGEDVPLDEIGAFEQRFTKLERPDAG